MCGLLSLLLPEAFAEDRLHCSCELKSLEFVAWFWLDFKCHHLVLGWLPGQGPQLIGGSACCSAVSI